MKLVVALGGNALLPPGGAFDLEAQRRTVRATAAVLAPLCRAHRTLVTHGNGPQVGYLAGLAERGEAAPAFPLDIAGAESDAMIGYVVERELRGCDPGLATATVLTMVAVDPDDPAFAAPTKPVGPVYPPAQADAIARRHGWLFGEDRGGRRRLVASPRPCRILGLHAIAALAEAGFTVICCGGGGIPVAESAEGLRGVEAVIDKDRVSALLAAETGADALLLLTDVDGVYRERPGDAFGPIAAARPGEIRALTLPPGTMGPKAEAACDFVERTGGFAAIGRLADAAALLDGEAGTTIRA